MNCVIIAPSILAADFSKLNDEIISIQDAGADWLHFDVMDGHFVPNISFGLPVLSSLKGKYSLVNDVHLMIENPKKFVQKFIEAGANFLTFHYEACSSESEVNEIIDLIHSYGSKAGISIKPNTDVKVLNNFIHKLDLVLIMSVEPGLGGQAFIPSSLDKISYLHQYIIEHNSSALISVDGGINDETGPLCFKAGANVLVSGSYLFGHKDIKERIEKLGS